MENQGFASEVQTAANSGAQLLDAKEHYLPPSSVCVNSEESSSSQEGKGACDGINPSSITCSITEISAIDAD